MADTQSTFSEDVTMEDPCIQFLKTITNVCKQNRDLLSSLPEVMEFLLVNGEGPLNQMCQFEEHRRSMEEQIRARDKSLNDAAEYVKAKEGQCRELQEENRILAKREGDIASKEKEIEERIKESYQKRERELQEVKEEISRREDEITKREKLIMQKKKNGDEDFQKMQRELHELKKEVTKKDDDKRKREKEIMENDKLHKENFQKLQRELHELKEEVTKKDDDKRKREKEILENDKLHEEKISKLIEELKKTHRKMEDYKTRLASISERQVKLDQRKAEDTHALNRQSDLEKDFAMFFDGERLDACEAMLSVYQNKEDEFNFIYYPRLACIILETAYEQAQEARNACVDLFKECTRIMVDDAAQMGTKVIQKRKLFMEGKGAKDPQQLLKACVMKEPTKFPKDAIDGVLLSMKENAESCDLDSLMERDPVKGKEGFLDKVFEKWIKWCNEDKTCLFTPSYHLLEKLDQYIKACLRLSWRIVTQVPPMNLEYQTLKLNSNIHKKLGYHTSFKGREKSLPSREENKEEEIACYIWPGLQDGGGRVIRVGEVLCVIQEDEKSGNRPERKR